MKKLKAFIMVLVFVGGGYMLVEVNFNEEILAYDRKEWKHWTDADKDCQDTRQEVLIRDSLPNALQLSEDGCRVISGEWHDPYSGEIFTDPKDLDNDHLVPLKEAWLSGAYAWDKKRLESYANYLNNDYHLIVVKARENRKKGAKAPHEYLPPNKEYQCEYVVQWTKVKHEWNLSFIEEELLAIEKACE